MKIAKLHFNLNLTLRCHRGNFSMLASFWHLKVSIGFIFCCSSVANRDINVKLSYITAGDPQIFFPALRESRDISFHPRGTPTTLASIPVLVLV